MALCCAVLRCAALCWFLLKCSVLRKDMLYKAALCCCLFSCCAHDGCCVVLPVQLTLQIWHCCDIVCFTAWRLMLLTAIQSNASSTTPFAFWYYVDLTILLNCRHFDMSWTTQHNWHQTSCPSEWLLLCVAHGGNIGHCHCLAGGGANSSEREFCVWHLLWSVRSHLWHY